MTLSLRRMLLALLMLALALPLTAQARTLKYSDHDPLGGMRSKYIKDVFFAAIEKESQGRLKIEDYWGGVLANGNEALRVVGDGGVVDMALIVPEYAPNDLPLHQIFKSFPAGPGKWDDQLALYQRVHKEIPEFPAELKKKNVVNILFSTGLPVAFFSTKPLNTLNDIKDNKWRASSRWHLAFLQNAGANPVSLPWGETYMALQTRTLDGLMVNLDGGHMIKSHEAAPNVLVSQGLWWGTAYLLVMNADTWDELSKDDQAAIQRAAATAYAAFGGIVDTSFSELIDDMKQSGTKVRILEPQELEDWKTATKYPEVQAKWVKEQQERGMKNADEILGKVAGIVNDTLAKK